MTSLRYEHRHLNVACDLDVSDVRARVIEWQELRDRYGLGVERTPQGARLWLRLEAEAAARLIVEHEAQCCGFLDFEMTSEDARIRLDISSPSAPGAQVAAALAGIDPTGQASAST